MARPKKEVPTETDEITSGQALREAVGGDEKLMRMALGGIPVREAWFQSAVNNGIDVPESNFSDSSLKPGRRVQMWMCPPILLCLHHNKYFFTPLANVQHARFK